MQRTKSRRVSNTFMALSMVSVPDSPAKPFADFADPMLVFEIFYTVIVFNHVLDYRSAAGGSVSSGGSE